MRPREGSGRALQSAVDEVDEGDDQARASMHLVLVHRLRGSEQDVEAAETEFRKALLLAISSEDGELLGYVFVQPARLLRDDKGDARGAREAAEILHGLVSRVAEAGRLRVGVERAVGMIHAAGSGVTLALIGTEPEERDLALSEATREAVLATVTTNGSDGEATEGDGRERAANRAVALKAVLSEAEAGLTPGERALLSEWLDRIADPAR